MASADLIDIPANLNNMPSPVQQKRKVEEESVAARTFLHVALQWTLRGGASRQIHELHRR